MPRVKIRAHLPGPLERYGRGQPGVRSEHPRARCALGGGIEMHDLPDRVHARVGAAGANGRYARAGNEREGCLDRVLHGR